MVQSIGQTSSTQRLLDEKDLTFKKVFELAQAIEAADSMQYENRKIHQGWQNNLHELTTDVVLDHT